MLNTVTIVRFPLTWACSEQTAIKAGHVELKLFVCNLVKCVLRTHFQQGTVSLQTGGNVNSVFFIQINEC